jgi:hypothetical protein
LPALAQTAALSLALALALALLLAVALAVPVPLVAALLQPARNAAATTAATQPRATRIPAAHGTLPPVAVMPAACKTRGPPASPAPGEGHGAATRTWVSPGTRCGKPSG